MKHFFASIVVILASIFMSGCHGRGSSAPAPNNVTVVAGDTSATVTWSMVPGVDYWVFKAAGTDVTPLSCYQLSQCQMLMHAVSPTVVSGLANGTVYSFTINGRIDGGKGGPGSPSIQATPRLAGAIWSTGAPAGANDLRGVAFGSSATYGNIFIAVGVTGALFSSTNGINWTALVNPLPAVTLNAVTYYGGKYLAVGAGGVILLSTDGITFTPQTSGTGNVLNAVTNNGLGVFVATGANGTIITSPDGISWTVVPPVTPNALYGITYGNSKFVAVGATGTLLTSTDGSTWQTVTLLSAAILRGIAYGAVNGTSSVVPTFAALGDTGTLVTSIDGGATWVLQAPITSTPPFNAVTFGHQFVAVSNVGSIFASIDGLAWTSVTSPATTALNAVTHGPYDYSAVGATGLNLYSK